MSSRNELAKPALSIRQSTGAAEYPALASIWRGAVDATHDFLADAHRDEIEAKLHSDYPAVVLSVAARDGRPVGFSGVRDETLEMLFVDGTQRDGGIGSAFSPRTAVSANASQCAHHPSWSSAEPHDKQNIWSE